MNKNSSADSTAVVIDLDALSEFDCLSCSQPLTNRGACSNEACAMNNPDGVVVFEYDYEVTVQSGRTPKEERNDEDE